MAFESKHVLCEYCKGERVTLVVAYHPETESLGADTLSCAGCDGTGMMEIRKSERFDWASKCLTCEGKGFNDTLDFRSGEHDTVECVECNGTGGIAYLQPVA
jgi:DnaJ-class molecular chaperone